MNGVIFKWMNRIYRMSPFGDVFYNNQKIFHRDASCFWLYSDYGGTKIIPEEEAPTMELLDNCWDLISPKKFFSGRSIKLQGENFLMGRSGRTRKIPTNTPNIWFSKDESGWWFHYKRHIQTRMNEMMLLGATNAALDIRTAFDKALLRSQEDYIARVWAVEMATNARSIVAQLDVHYELTQTEYYKTLDRVFFRLSSGSLLFCMFESGTIYIVDKNKQGNSKLVLHSVMEDETWKHFDRNNVLVPIKKKWNERFRRVFNDVFGEHILQPPSSS